MGEGVPPQKSCAWRDIEREVLIAFDLLLVVVVGLHLYAISARDPLAEPGLFDKLQFLMVVSALLVDTLALITEFGFTPNRTAALGENLILMANLAGAAVLYARPGDPRTDSGPPDGRRARLNRGAGGSPDPDTPRCGMGEGVPPQKACAWTVVSGHKSKSDNWLQISTLSGV